MDGLKACRFDGFASFRAGLAASLLPRWQSSAPPLCGAGGLRPLGRGWPRAQAALARLNRSSQAFQQSTTMVNAKRFCDLSTGWASVFLNVPCVLVFRARAFLIMRRCEKREIQSQKREIQSQKREIQSQKREIQSQKRAKKY
jgi:hypothetical protein